MKVPQGRRPLGATKRVVRAIAMALRLDPYALQRGLRQSRVATLSFLVRWSGIALFCRHTHARRKAAILVYHNPAPDVLEQHLRYLTKTYRLVTLDELVDAIRSGSFDRLPPRSLVITIDDGHAGNAALLPLFERFCVVPTIFLCTQIAGKRRRFWWTEVDTRTRDHLHTVPNAERLRILERDFGFTQEAETNTAEGVGLSAPDLDRMLGRVDFQAHTRFHPVLPLCSLDECREEIAGSKAEVEALTGRPCRHFSYPNGYYTEREQTLLREAGYSSARTIETGWNDAKSDPFRLKVLGSPDDASVNLLAAQLTGLPYVRSLMYR